MSGAGSQGEDWASYQGQSPKTAGLAYAFSKITQGLGYENPYWKTQQQDALSNGLIWGGYAYPVFRDDPIRQVQKFLNTVNWRPGFMAAFDWEGYDTENQGVPVADQVAFKETFMNELNKELTTNPAGMYANLQYWRNYDKTSNCGDFLWIATGGLPMGHPGIQHPWMFHQYSTAGGVDHDYCPLTRDELEAWALSFAGQKPKPVVLPKISLAHVQYASQHDPNAPQGHTTFPADVKLLEHALQRQGLLSSAYANDGSYGSLTVKAYATWQHLCGYSGAAADGHPGRDSLTKLGKKFGFEVV